MGRTLTRDIRHGELIRDGYDDKMISTLTISVLYQGVLWTAADATNCCRINWIN